MPSFSFQIPNLYKSGPMVDVLIVPPRPLIEALKKNNQNIPEPVSAIALIDTGATNSVLKPEIIKKLGLNPIDKVLIATPSCYGVECYQYHAAIMFPNNVIVETSTLIEAPLEGQTINCLIGRDILRHSVFIYNGYVEMLTLSF